MKDIFEIDDCDYDPFLDMLVMTTALGGLSLSLDMYTTAIRRGLSSEEAYELSVSKDNDSCIYFPPSQTQP